MTNFVYKQKCNTSPFSKSILSLPFILVKLGLILPMPKKIKLLFMLDHNSRQTLSSNYRNPNKRRGQNNIEAFYQG